MKFAIISGSHRPESQSGKVARYLAKRLKELDASFSSHVLDLGKTPLPLWDESIWQGNSDLADQWKPISAELAASDAIIVISPEWAGMVPAALKNFMLYVCDGCVYHKPGLLVGVSSARNGAYPIAELRSSSYKNTHLQYISEHVIIRFVNDVLNLEDPESEEDALLRKRIDYSLNVLAEYGKALRLVRASGVLNHKEFPYGM
ncbi:NAD(P)H-dependent oxidoreductase [Candidatus Methylospira mobilis]|uniref:NADPH-dependent FMN reductase n=1 Tax=Candidatus Methylospira mobilis TaxID=1808979 RepID=UPI0028EEA599|nr:NAD(P)H-dependent oxidoreductase [Candidatus Methylospira mobilis]WNV03326.1 NAD(P)H-dependent oxidoreductase [Candidatus Methylospira mobilis]